MINFDDKELRAAGERLKGNRDFQLVAEALRQEYIAQLLESAASDIALRETCYTRHAVLNELQEVVTELDRLKKESEKYER